MCYNNQEGNHTPSTKPILSHIAIWERDPQSLGVTGDELHDGAERGPVHCWQGWRQKYESKTQY